VVTFIECTVIWCQLLGVFADLRNGHSNRSFYSFRICAATWKLRKRVS